MLLPGAVIDETKAKLAEETEADAEADKVLEEFLEEIRRPPSDEPQTDETSTSSS